MAKVPFTKLKCKIDDSIKQVKINDEITIEVKQYLPIQEKLGLIGGVIELSHEQDLNYSNPTKIKAFTELEILFAYSNITFTDKQKEDIPKLYDSLKSSGIIDMVINNIPKQEYETIEKGIIESVESVYKYQNSVLGLLDIIKTDYKNLDLDLEKLKNSIADPELVGFLNETLTNLN